jgi:hypothetical protein
VRRARGAIDVFTFKEGLLSRAAHDLHLRMEGVTVTLDGEELRCELPLGELRLVGPVEGGVTRPERYDEARRAEVERAMRDEVLHLERHPTALFTGKATAREDGFQVSGELLLAGRRAPLSFEVRRDRDTWQLRFELAPSRWGIAQYRAMLGTIRVQDLARIEGTFAEG